MGWGRWGSCALVFVASTGCLGDDEVVPSASDARFVADAAPSIDAATQLAFVVPPSLEMAPNADAPLVGVMTLETNRPTRVVITLDDGTDAKLVSPDELATAHSVLVLGFIPDRTYEVGVRVIDEADETLDFEPALSATTDPLPIDFPIVDVVVADVVNMEPGVTMFTSGALNGTGYVIMVDESGDVVWYLRHAATPSDTRRLSNGNLLFNTSNRLSAVEVTMRGDVVNAWHASNSTDIAGSTPVATDSFHHELFAMDSGNFLVVSSEQRTYDDYPTSELDPTPRDEPTNVIGDLIVEFEPDGTIVGEWSMLDILDPYRVGYDSFGAFWSSFYMGGGLDWSHANAAIHDPTDDTIIVSMRHQDAIVKFDRTGQLVWIMGPHENWDDPWDDYLLTPTDMGFAFQYHQHAPQVTPSGTLLMFDNGAFRASPPDPPAVDEFSRALEVDIDPLTMEVTEVWSYDADQLIYSRIVGDADRMPTTGNVLVCFGGLLPSAGTEPSARIIEVTHATPPVEVFELHVTDNNPSGSTIVYRAERLSGLYP